MEIIVFVSYKLIFVITYILRVLRVCYKKRFTCLYAAAVVTV